MLNLLFRALYFIGGYSFGMLIRVRQEAIVGMVQPYQPCVDDELEELEFAPDVDTWLAEFEFPTEQQTQFLISIPPQAAPAVPARVYAEIASQDWMKRVLDHLTAIDHQIGELRQTLDDSEAGRLKANMEYIVDFATAFGHTLVLIYLRQVDYARFATILEEIDLQCAQIESSIQRRLQRFQREFEEQASEGSWASDHRKQMLEEWIVAQGRWLTSVCARCIAGYLRITLPKANRAFVIRQLTRLKKEHVRETRTRRAVLNALLLQFGEAPNEDSSDIELLQQLASRLPDTQKEAAAELVRLQQACDDLLAHPRRVRKEARRYVARTVTVVVERDPDGVVRGIWRLTRNRQPIFRKLLRRIRMPRRAEPVTA